MLAETSTITTVWQYQRGIKFIAYMSLIDETKQKIPLHISEVYMQHTNNMPVQLGFLITSNIHDQSLKASPAETTQLQVSL